LVIVRENTEGLFSARLTNQVTKDEACDVLRLTRKGCERVIRFAFDLARKRRRHCTLVDKANVLPSMVFFRRIFDQIAEQYPDVATERVYVDAMALFLVRKPQAFDVIVTENMFGDILSDLAGGLVGGMGMAPSGDIGDNCAVFQPAHGTAPDIAGKGIANPIAMILSAAMMLEWLGHEQTVLAGRRVESAIRKVFEDPANRTPDMGGKLSTSEITNLIIDAL
jgi:3-isopropylmalate dehydrogenase